MRSAFGILLMGLGVLAQTPTASITGEIHTRDGVPAVGVRVAAMAASSPAIPPTLLGIAQTDAAGRFRLEGVPAGRYYVVAGPVERPLYHPGVDTPGGATVVSVAAGADAAGLNFTVDLARLSVPDARPLLRMGQSVTLGCPAGPVPAPAQPLGSADFVQLQRTACYGSCPEYTVRISADGTVNWSGGRYVQVSGMASAAVDAARARDLIERYRANGFWSLCGSYSAPVTDGPTFYTTVGIGGQEKRVSNYFNAAPAWVGELEREIDRLADTHRWVHGDPRSEALNFNSLDSDSAAGTKPGITPLMQASGRRGSVDQIRALLASKADANARDASGWTALMYAALANDPAMIQALLDAGADPNARSFAGRTPLMAHVSMVVINRDPIAPIQLLLAAGADLNATDNNGQTALMLLVSQDIERDETLPRAVARVNLITFLRNNGARADLRDASGRTTLDILTEAAERAPVYSKVQYERIRMILEQPVSAGAPVEVR